MVTFFEYAQGAAVNIFVLLGFVALCTLRSLWAGRNRRPLPAWRLGLLFGLMATVAMFVPVFGGKGVIFDSRSGVVGAGALLGGPVAALFSLPLPIIYRLYIAGPGLIPGIMEILFPALLGSLCHLWLTRKSLEFTTRRIVISSAIAGLLSTLAVVAYIFLKSPSLLDVMPDRFSILVFILTAPISMALLASLTNIEHKHIAAVNSLAESERRMLHSQKMAAVGQLARKVAHSFANALTTIIGNAELARESPHDPAEVERLMDNIIEAGTEVSHLDRDLLAFSSPGNLNTRRMRLDKCLTGMEKVLRKTIGPEIEIEFVVDKDTGYVDIDPERIEQAIVHMAVNASEAMDAHGRLTVSVAPARLSFARRRQLQAGVHKKNQHKGHFAVLSVRDTGPGMNEETRLRVFEPFFTTKQDRQNSGLGLSTVYNIARQHDGFIEVRSTPGKGTVFSIYLPVTER